LFLLGRVEISVSFIQNVVENWIEIKFLVVEAYTLEKFWYKELTKRRKMVEMTGGLFQV
jgi:hypothetical protein